MGRHVQLAKLLARALPSALDDFKQAVTITETRAVDYVRWLCTNHYYVFVGFLLFLSYTPHLRIRVRGMCDCCCLLMLKLLIVAVPLAAC